jgi:phage tail sheath gpL-like
MSIASGMNQVEDSFRPRQIAQLTFSASPGASAAGYKKIYIMGERLATGTLAANQSGQIFDGDDGAVKFGAGSFGAWMARQVFRGPEVLQAEVFAVPLTEPAGVAAAAVYTFATNATSNGIFTVNVAGTVFKVPVISGDTPTIVGASMVTAFGQLDNERKPPCTPVNAIGVVTCTMNNKGASGNSAPSYQIITGEEPTGMTLTVGGVTFGQGTAGTLYPTITTALANLVNVVTPCIVHGFDETPDGSTTNLDLVRDHIITKTNAEIGHRAFQIACLTKPLATIVSDIATLDDNDSERARICGIALDPSTNSPGTWHVSAACYVARLWGIWKDTARPFYNEALQYMVQPPDDGDILLNSEVDTLIEGGCTVLNWNGDRQRYLLIRGIGARLFNGRPQDWGIVDGSDWFRFNYLINLAAAFPAGTKLAENGETSLDLNTTTPEGVLDVWVETVFSEQMVGVLRNRETLVAQGLAEINSGDETRVDVTGPHAVMNGLAVVASHLRQVGGVIGQAQG